MRVHIFYQLLLLLTLLWQAPISLAAGQSDAKWCSSPEDSELRFFVRFEGTDTPGVFGRFQVDMDFDSNTLTDSSLEVTIPIVSADMNSPDLNEGMLQPEWFGAADFPIAEFRSTQIEPTAEADFVALGSLSLKGNEQAVNVPFTWQSNGERARIQGSLILSRIEFGIGLGEWSDDSTIGHAVRVEFDVALAPCD